MSFAWPEALWLLGVLPVLVAVYVMLMRRKRKALVRYANLLMVKQAMGAAGQWRRHVPPVLFLLALTVLLLAIARPEGMVVLPSQQQTIILAMDVSGSMRARDVKPSRLEAMQEAARAFIKELPGKSTRIGVIAFAGTASVVQQPTENREDVLAAIDRFQLQRATAIGSGIIVSLATLFPDHGLDVSEMIYGRERRPHPREQREAQKAKPEFKPVPPGSHPSAAIILLTDGQRTTGPDSIEAAKLAADRGVRIFTVGIGTKEGDVIGFEGWSFRVRLDEETLKQIAAMTRAEYFYAGTAQDLKKVYEALGTRIVLERKQTEITAVFAAVAAVLALLAAGLSLAWFSRIL